VGGTEREKTFYFYFIFKWLICRRIAQELTRLAEDIWPKADKPLRQRMAPLAAGAAWNLKLWKNMDEYITVMPDTSVRCPPPPNVIAPRRL
jgi:hypothetical protein